MAKIISVIPLDNFRIYVKYSDGLEGELSLKHLIKRDGYKMLVNPEVFNSVRINPKSKDIIWNGGISICKFLFIICLN